MGCDDVWSTSLAAAARLLPSSWAAILHIVPLLYAGHHRALAQLPAAQLVEKLFESVILIRRQMIPTRQEKGSAIKVKRD